MAAPKKVIPASEMRKDVAMAKRPALQSVNVRPFNATAAFGQGKWNAAKGLINAAEHIANPQARQVARQEAIRRTRSLRNKTMNAEANASTRNMSSETWMLPAAKQKMLAKDVSTQQGNAAKAADSYDTATAFYRSVNPNGVANNKNVFSSPSERNKNYKGKGK